ncbi:MAG: FG-GAP-like repeat-containing protein [Planctomycetia bacterium]|nr:FG-GAP-like repeat-containing protein [Planctomycetia bacterium]
MLFLSWLHRLRWPATIRQPSSKRPSRQRKLQEGILALTAEGLEARQVLTGTVVVNTFNDLPDADLLDGVADADLGTTGLQTSLRAAVMHANATAGLETIVLSAGTYQLTIDGNGENNSESGDLDLFSDIEIIGAGSQNTTIEMGFAGGIGPAIQDRVFDIFGASKVLIQGVKIQKGQTVDFGEVGGGVRANSDVELRNVILTNNQTGLNGGGLSVGFVGSVTLVGSTVTSNSAVFNGGGISSQGTLKVYDSSVTNNTTGANGGGIASAGSLEVIRSFIQGNVANANGGGIDSNSGSATIIGSTIKSNSATTGRGGGLNLSGNGSDTMPANISADIQFSELADNTAQSGGGILMNSSALLSLRNSTLAGNTATGTATVGGQAGGLLQLRGNTVVSDSTFSGNSATSQAGATASEGGGLFHQGGTLSFLNATIANNSAGNGGGLASRAASDPSKNRISLQNTIVATNTATMSGPDLFATSSSLNSSGHNLIGVGINPFANNVNGDIVGTLASPVNPQLAPLANYGGGTRTQKLNAGSPAIDAGSNLGVSGSDQRGVPRILNGGTSNTADIGAVEAGFTGFFVNSEIDSTDINPGDGVAIDAAGKTSLRAAIQEANALAGTQTIVVPAGNYRLTISGAIENSAASGDLDITQSLNIRGAGAAATIIDGNFSDRVFDIFSGAATTISGMSITNGMRNGTGLEARGGGIRINSASVLLDQVAIRNNLASGLGGGISNESSRSGGGLTIRNSSLQFNRGSSGGAVHNFNDTLVIENSLFDSNNAVSGPGGALAHVGPGTISGSRFSHNTSSASGGAIAISQNIASPATTTISGSEISENTATAGFGGGLLVDRGRLTVLRSSVNGNHNLSATGLAGGGGIAAIGNGATLNVTESQIHGNTSNVPGGGLFLQPSTTTNVLRSTISRNMATDGSGISNAGTLTIENSTVSQNNSSGNGGGLFDSGTTTISSSTFSTNSAAMGGGIFATNAGTRSLKNTIVAGNFSLLNIDADVSGTSFTTNGNNLIGDIDTAVGFLAETNGDIVGGDGGTAIDSVSSNTTSPIVVTVTDHGLQTGDRLRIKGVTGNTAANGTFTITRINANQFSLNNSMPNGDYGGGGDFFFLIDPRLGPLANNTNPFAQNANFGNPGGSPAVVTLFPQTPETHALLLGSPAIDRGNDSGSQTTDQRGFARINVAGVGVNGVSTDIGAVELFHTTASGLVFSDLNGNGLRDVNEQGRGGVTVYLDSNANGSLDPDEPFASTAFFDNPLTPEIEEVGSYTLTFIPPGTQVISELLPFNARQTSGMTPPRFSSAMEIATGADPSSVITGDFNNDGTTDVAFVQTSANLLTIVPRMPDGSWETPISFTVGSTPKEVVAGDLNGDGRLDLVVVNKDSNNLSVFFSNATGFNAVQNFAVGTSPRAIVLVDLDHDGDLDIAVANEGSDDVSLLQQTSSGVFTTLPAVSVGDGPRDIIATDFDNDGQIDLVTADKLSNEISLLRNDNSGITFTRTAINVSGTLPSSLLAEDVDRDGDVDLVFGAVGTGEVLLLENSGTGMFGPPVALLSGVDPTSLGSADVDLDGDADLFVPNESASGTITVLVNDNGAFPNSFVFATGTQPAAIAFADFNSDGRRDLITANIGSDNLTVLSNLTCSYSVTAVTGTPLSNRDFGNQDFATVTGTIFNDFSSNGLQDRDELGVGGVPVFLDMNGNGRLDSFEPQTTTSFPGPFGGLTGNYFFQGVLPGKYRVYQILTPGFVQTTPRSASFDEEPAVPTGDFISDILTTDLNNDGKTDVVSLSRESSGNGLAHIFLGTTNGLGNDITVGVGSQPRRVQVADLDHDGDLDVLVMNSGDNSVSLIRNDAGTFSVVSTVVLSGTPNDLTVGDLNGDGDADFVVSLTRASGNDSIEIFKSAGGLTFNQSFLSDANNDTAGIALVDLDNDRDLDLVAVNRATDEVLLFSNDGTGGFTEAGIFATAATPGAVAIGYFNGDALPDIAVVSQSTNQVSIRNSVTPFVYAAATSFSTTSPVSDLVVADVNRDGLDDLAITTTSGKLIVAQGTLNGMFQAQTDATFFASTTGSALAFANFNDDTLLDVIIGQDAAAASLMLGTNQLFGAQVNLASGGFTNVNFGSVELGTIRGRVFIDANSNGVRDPGEDDGFGDLQVFVDLNRNGHRDPDEPTDVTGGHAGVFTINGVAPNKSHLVVAESPLGTLRTGPFGLQFGPATFVSISDSRPQFIGELLATHDFDLDGVPELLTVNPDGNSLTITTNINGGFNTDTIPVGQTPTAIRLGNLNGNSQPDVIVANNVGNSLTVFFDGVFTTATTISGITNPRAIELIDVNNDGKLDVVVTSSSSGDLTILTNNGFGGFTSNILTVTGADSGEDIARADIDGDGDQDLVFIDSSNDKAFVLRNNSDGTLTHIGTFTTGDNPISLDSAGDFDLDLDQDFILTTAGDKTIQVLLNNSSGNFTAVTKATLTNIPGAIDFNIPSRRIAVTLPGHPVLAIFAVNPDATLNPPRFVSATGGQDSVLLVDLNKDGKSDLLSTDFDNGKLNINDNWTSPIPGTFEVRLDPGETLEGLAFATQDLRSTAIVLNGNDLQIDDILGGNSDDNWTLTIDASGVTLHSNTPNEFLTSGIAGATGDGTNRLTIPLAAFSGGIIFHGGAGTDTLTLNVTTGFSRTITFNGGAPTSGSGDTLILQSGDTFDSATYSFTDASSGSIQFSGNGSINYTGLEPILSSVAADHVSLQFGGDSEIIELTAGASGQTVVDSTSGESLAFLNPNKSLTVLAGAGDDTVNVGGLDADFRAALTINGETGSDVVSLGSSLLLGSAASTGNLTLTAESILLNAALIATNGDTTNNLAGTVTINGAVTLGIDVTINTNGSTASDGAVNLNAVDGLHSLTVMSGAAPTTFNGAVGAMIALADLDVTADTIGLTANVNTDGGSLTFVGNTVLNADILIATGDVGNNDSGSVSFSGSSISATGSSRSLTINTVANGTGSSGAATLATVDDSGGSAIRDLIIDAKNLGGGAAGDVTFTDVLSLAGNGSLVAEGRTISLSTSNSDVSLTGTASITLHATRNINVATGASMQAVDGDISLEANQQGTPTTSSFSGIELNQGTIRTTGLGSISLLGRSGNAGNLQYGILMQNSSLIETTGSGEIELLGESRGTSGPENDGILIASSSDLLANTGQISLQGIGGVGGTSEGIGVTDSDITIATTDAPITFVADVIHVGVSQPSFTAGSGNRLTLRPLTFGTPIGLGAASSSEFSLSDGQLDRITAGTVQIGDSNSGAITISNAISRPTTTNLNLTAGSNKDITFSGGTAGLNTNGGNVSLSNSGTGAITSGTAPNDIIANRVSLISGSGGIGVSGNPLSFDANQLVTNSSGNANQFLKEAGSVLIDVAGLTAGTGTIQFSGGTFTLNGSNRIADSTLLDVPSGATFKLNGFLETIAGLTGSGSVLNGSGSLGNLTLNLADDSTFNGFLGGATANDQNCSLDKSGTGTLTLTRPHTYTGLTRILAGTLLLNGSLTSDVVVASGGTFGGSGTIGGGHTLTINNGGTLAPGNSPGIVNSGSVTFNSGSIFSVELNGTTVGTGYDQLNVTGTVDLNGATLDAILGFTPAAGATFVIVNNDGSDAINGTFGSLSQGALLTIAGKKFHIYYDFDNGGGQNNDVALIVNRAPQFNAQTFNFNENSANNTAVGTAVASDADGGSLNYAITAGNTSNAFAMNATTGAIRVNNAAAIDFETNPVFSLTVDVTDDAGAVTTKTITINLNDLQSNLSINNASTSEGDSGTKTLTFNVKSSTVINNAFTIDFNTSKATAGDGLLGSDTDFVANSGTLNFAGNAANESKTVTITINGDTVIEGDETFIVLLSNLLGTNDVTITTATGAGTITNDDSSTLTISSPTITEGDSGTTTMTFTVTSPKAVEGGFTVAFNVSDITTNSSDYTVVTSSPLTFSGTANETQTITININGDTIIEGDETFSITLGTVTPVAPVAAASITSGATGTGTITNNDTSTLTISSPTITEGNSGTTTMTFTVTSPKAVEGGFTVAFSATDITANASDYTVVTSSPLTFSGTANETKTITVNINGDAVIEGDETFSITLGTVTPVAPVAAASFTSGAIGTGTITNNDTSTLGISSPSITEANSGTTTMTFTVTSPKAVEGGFTVSFDVADITTNGSDYTVVTSSPLTFSGTENETKTITINVNGDAVIEGDETFSITLGTVTPVAPVDAASITTGAVGTGTITNNDTSTLTISSPTITEANSGTTTMTFTVTSPSAVEGGFTVAFNVADITTNGSDYTVVTRSPLTFSGTANETQTITININGDTIIEGNETLSITLETVTPVAPVAAASITSGATGTGTITNNDTSTLTISSPTITEGDSGVTTMTFTVTSPNAVDGGFTVPFDVANVTAISSDYTVITSSPLTFSGTANETKTITINVNGDAVIEGDETFTITLGVVTPIAPVAAASITSGAVGTGTITNNDTSTLAISSPTITEANSGTTTMTFTITSPKAVEGGFTVPFDVTNVTTNGSDYTVVTSSPLTFSGTANETKTITINVGGDTLIEGDESFTITLGVVTPVAPVAAASITSDAIGTGTIANNDTSTLAISSPTITEGNSGTTTMTFTVTSPRAVEGGFTVAFDVADITTNGSDYTVVTSSPLTFSGTANETRTITVNVNGDTVIEGDETFSITLGTVTPVAPVADTSITIGAVGAVGTGTITNNDTSTLTISSPTVTEGDSGTTTMTFTVTSPKAVEGGFTVAFSVADITTNNSDYTVVTNSPLTFTGTANETQTITININGDDLAEATETLSVTLGTVTPVAPVAAASISSDASGTGTITNDDFAPVANSGGPYRINEGSGLPLNASGTTDADTPGSNLTYLWDIDGDGQFTENITGASPILAVSDLVTLGLSNGLRRNNVTVQVSDGTNISTASTQLTINNLPPSPPVDLLADAVDHVVDGSPNGTTVGIQVLSTDPGNDSVTYRFTDNAGGRFAINASTGVITIANSLLLNSQVSSSHTVTVVATDSDFADSQPVSFTIEVQPAPPPTASVTPDTAYVIEGDSGFVYVVFAVRLSTPSVLPIDINFTTLLSSEPDAARDTDDPADANNPRDFYLTTGTIHFNPFSTEELIRIQIQPDLIAEMDETFLIQLTSATNADLSRGSPVGSAIIRDDDTVPQLIVSAPQVLEGDPTSGTPNELVYTLTVSGRFDSSGHASLHFETGDIGDTADSGVDYTTISGDLDFSESQRTILVRVPIIGDLTDEADETVSLVFSNVSGLGIPVTSTTGTIINDDSPNPVLQINSQVIREGTGFNSTAIFTVTLIGKPSGPVNVNYNTLDETATAGSDYVAANGTLTFLPGGPVTQSIPVTIIGDSLPESAKETFALTLSSANNATVDSQLGIGSGSILDDDGNVITSEADQVAAELTAIFNQFGGDKNNPELVAALLNAAAGIATRLGFLKALVIVIDPVDFILNDTQGRQSGFTESTGVINQIPGTYYSGNGPVELLIVPLPPDGVYNLQLAGLGGPFNAAIAVTIGGETQTTSVSSSLENGSNLQVSINVGGTVPNSPFTLTIPVGLGLGGQPGNGNATFGVVGANDRFARRDFEAEESEERQSDAEMTLDESNDSPFDQLVNWIMIAKSTREKLVRQLFESLDLPFGNLLEPDSGAEQKLTDELVDLFWKRLGQTLTGVPAGAYKLGDMLENLLPQNALRPSKKTPAEQGKGEPGTNGKSTPKTKRSTETRQRSAPRSGEKMKSDANQQRSQTEPKEALTAQLADSEAAAKPQQTESTLVAFWNWLSSSSRRS